MLTKPCLNLIINIFFSGVSMGGDENAAAPLKLQEILKYFLVNNII